MINFKSVSGQYNNSVSLAVGILPDLLSPNINEKAAEQFKYTYAHGGGWNPFNGFEFDPEHLVLSYPGDPPMGAVAKAQLRDETILVFPHAWVLILQSDGSWEVCRMD